MRAFDDVRRSTPRQLLSSSSIDSLCSPSEVMPDYSLHPWQRAMQSRTHGLKKLSIAGIVPFGKNRFNDPNNIKPTYWEFGSEKRTPINWCNEFGPEKIARTYPFNESSDPNNVPRPTDLRVFRRDWSRTTSTDQPIQQVWIWTSHTNQPIQQVWIRITYANQPIQRLWIRAYAGFETHR